MLYPSTSSQWHSSVLSHAGFFENITPVNFNTIATPHAGLPRYPSLLSSLASVLVPKLLSRTGEQFYLTDKWSPKGRPLLVVMADPGELLCYHASHFVSSSYFLDRIFHQSLRKFQHIRIYANAQVKFFIKNPSCLMLIG